MTIMENNKKYKILFVCLGNICRSPAGQGVMERIVDERGLNDRIFIDSAGISSYHSGDLPDQRMRVHATRHTPGAEPDASQPTGLL